MQSLVTYTDKDFPLGYMDKYPAHALPKGYCALIQNGFLFRNRVEQRTGYTKLGVDTEIAKPNLGFHAYETGSTKQILKINDNAGGTAANLQYWNGATWTTVAAPTFTAGLPCSMVTALGKVYITNGTDVVKRWDGTTLTNIAGIPITKYLLWFHNYLWAIHSTTYKSRAYFSGIALPESYGPNDYIDISPDDGDFLTGSATIKDEIVFGKQYRVFSFQAWTETDFNPSQVNERLTSYGVTSDETFSNIGNDLLFLSFGGGIPHIRSLTRTRFADTEYGGVMSDAVTETMNSTSKGYLYKAASIFDGNKVWWFLPSGSSTYNNFALTYDTVTKGYAYHTGIYAARAIISTISGKPMIYFADSRNSNVYIMDGAYSDNGEAIDFKFITRQFEPDFKRFAKFKYLWLGYETGIDATFDAMTSVDSNPFELQEQVSLQSLSSSVFPVQFPFLWGQSNQGQIRIELPYSRNFNIQLQIEKNDTNAPMVLTSYEFQGYSKKLVELDNAGVGGVGS